MEAELVEKDMAPLVIVPERLQQRSRCLWPIIGYTAWGKERRRGLDAWKEEGEQLLRGRCRRDDNFWGCGSGHGNWYAEQGWAFGCYFIALSRR